MLSNPSDLLKIYLQEEVLVHLRGGELCSGVLKGFDEHLNILVAMEAESLFIRGENIMFIGQKC
ncbi:small nuclear ribonucleoprotein [Pancytospora philotis]|nr:small nuclear ribonucleoprotein [Pancytospora philotis]